MASSGKTWFLDRAAEETATTALRHSPYFFVRSVTCRCEDDAIVLEGEVPTFYQKQQAQETVARLPAMPTIDNRIAVRGF